MLKIGEERLTNKGWLKNLEFVIANAEALPFADNSFDLITMAFGLRNVTHQDKALAEMARVLKPGGSFAFQDLFDSKMVYGDIRRLFDRLRADGYTDLHYIGQVERQGFVPRFLRAPWMICHIGLIYGRKPGGQA